MALQNKSKSSLFLIEMIIVILVFAVASAVCASLFVNARLTSLDSTQLTMAVGRCQNAAECLRAVGEDPAALAEVLQASPQGEGRYLVAYDGQGTPTSLEDARYLLEISVLWEGEDLLRATITMKEQGSADIEPIYTLETTQYHPK